MRLPGRRPPRGRPIRPADGLRGLPTTRRGAPSRPGRPAVGRPSIWLPSVRLGRPSPTRAAALLGVLVAAGAVWGAAGSSAFTIGRLELADPAWTTRAAVLRAAAIPADANVFRLETEPIEARLEALPAVERATVRVSLPDGIRIELTERAPIMVWRIGDRAFVVDREGRLFAEAAPDAEALVRYPRIVDGRAASGGLRVTDRLEAVDLDAATRLAALLPADVGSDAEWLRVSVTDANGFVIRTHPESWVAIFGYYTPSLRTTDLIPGQVRLLRSLLAGREAEVAEVILADDERGTYIPRSPAP